MRYTDPIASLAQEMSEDLDMPDRGPLPEVTESDFADLSEEDSASLVQMQGAIGELPNE